MALFDKDRHIGIHGIGMSPATTWEQKKIILQLYDNLRDGFDEDYIIVPEWVINFSDLSERQPDIIIFDKDYREPLLIVEITPKSHYKESIKKIKEMMNDYATIEEGFVYDYEKKRWHVTRTNGDHTEPSYSQLLDVNFAEMIEL